MPATTSDGKDTAVLEKWETDCDNTFATLCLAITDSEMSHIEECTTAAEVWTKLAKVYEAKGVTQELYLRKQLSNFKLDDGNTIQQHINKLNEIVKQLASIREKISNRSIAMTLLSSLPKSYNMLKVSLGNTPDKITTDLIKQWALEEEARIKEEDSDVEMSENVALFSQKGKGKAKNAKPTKGKGKGKKDDENNNKPKPKCSHCKRTGHKEANCWILHPKK